MIARVVDSSLGVNAVWGTWVERRTAVQLGVRLSKEMSRGVHVREVRMGWGIVEKHTGEEGGGRA